MFIIRGDFNVQVYGLSVSRSVFHLLHIDIVTILREYKKKIFNEMGENQFCLFLTFLIKWGKFCLIMHNVIMFIGYVALKFKDCSHSPQCTFTAVSVWDEFIVPVDNLIS